VARLEFRFKDSIELEFGGGSGFVRSGWDHQPHSKVRRRHRVRCEHVQEMEFCIEPFGQFARTGRGGRPLFAEVGGQQNPFDGHCQPLSWMRRVQTTTILGAGVQSVNPSTSPQAALACGGRPAIMILIPARRNGLKAIAVG
jgi:hypothetical protein